MNRSGIESVKVTKGKSLRTRDAVQIHCQAGSVASHDMGLMDLTLECRRPGPGLCGERKTSWEVLLGVGGSQMEW